MSKNIKTVKQIILYVILFIILVRKIEIKLVIATKTPNRGCILPFAHLSSAS